MDKNNYKKTRTWFIVNFMIFTFLFIAGCQQEELLLLENEENGNVKEQTDEIKKTSLSYETWSQQLDYLVNECPEVDFITNQGLHLDEYKLLEHKIGNEVLLRESSFMPFYSSPESPNDFNVAYKSTCFAGGNVIQALPSN